MDRFEARKKVVETLQEQGLLVKEEEYTTRTRAARNAAWRWWNSHISTQWFVNHANRYGRKKR